MSADGSSREVSCAVDDGSGSRRYLGSATTQFGDRIDVEPRRSRSGKLQKMAQGVGLRPFGNAAHQTREMIAALRTGKRDVPA